MFKIKYFITFMDLMQACNPLWPTRIYTSSSLCNSNTAKTVDPRELPTPDALRPPLAPFAIILEYGNKKFCLFLKSSTKSYV